MENDFWNRLKDKYVKKYGNEDAFNKEEPILSSVLKEIESEIKTNYQIIEPSGMGGAGIVIRIKDKLINMDRALKIPRPKDSELIDSVKNEIEYLRKIKHENIISLYTLGEVKTEGFPSPYPYFVMAYIKDVKDLREKAIELLKNGEDRIKNGAETSVVCKDITKWVSEIFFKITSAIYFLHKQNIIHFDIKPSNIMMDENNQPLLSDLGFAKTKKETNEEIPVGFTIFYAHPKLKFNYTEMTSKNRVIKRIPPKDFKFEWDIYALGKSLLEILSLIYTTFPETVLYDYNFLYLHLAACRMLDGNNMSDTEYENIRLSQTSDNLSVYKENWMGLENVDFKQIKYKNSEEIIIDFEKISNSNPFQNSVPEINLFYPKIIQSSTGTPAPFSNRVKYLIEHPVFKRLSSIPQLGFTDNLYPTATHNRLVHSVGTFRNCCLYVQALLNDPYNPLFKQLITAEDIKSVLLASLLHDIGQYPLAHDIEEYDSDFKHEIFSKKFFENPTKDRFKNTLKDIIEKTDWWGVSVEKVKEILFDDEKTLFKEENLKTNMLASIINGPIDVDKLDYLLRDSKNCYLKYGEIVDIERLIRNLTIVIYKKDNKIFFSLGAYEKGQPAAESLTFARYLLYQSLYWHHTTRGIRTMIKEAIAPAIKNKKLKKPFIELFEEFLGICGNPRVITPDDVLNYIEKHTDSIGKDFINLLKRRNYYKRILTIHITKEELDKKSDLQRFREIIKKAGFQECLQKDIMNRFRTYLDSTQSSRLSMLSPEKINTTVQIMAEPKKILCDAPEPSAGSEDLLRFTPEPQRLHKNYEMREKIGERVSEVWERVHFTLMNIAAKGRIYCHPDIRDTLMAALGPESLREILFSVIKKFESPKQS